MHTKGPASPGKESLFQTPSFKSRLFHTQKEFASNRVVEMELFLHSQFPTPMAEGRSTKIISMIKWMRTSGLSMKHSLYLLLEGDLITPHLYRPLYGRVEGEGLVTSCLSISLSPLSLSLASLSLSFLSLPNPNPNGINSFTLEPQDDAFVVWAGVSCLVWHLRSTFMFEG